MNRRDDLGEDEVIEEADLGGNDDADLERNDSYGTRGWWCGKSEDCQ